MFLIDIVDKIIQFSKIKKFAINDYKEYLKLIIICLGGILPS